MKLVHHVEVPCFLPVEYGQVRAGSALPQLSFCLVKPIQSQHIFILKQS